MPVSTDGILLGAWAKLPNEGHIVDIGAGSGLLSLMAAQRAPAGIQISAIEIDNTAAVLAKENVANSPWPSTIKVYQKDVRQWVTTQAAHSIDGIVCNPPYFNSGETSHQQVRATARHTSEFSHQDLLTVIATLLKDNAEAHLILPLAEGEALLTSLEKSELHCIRRCEVRTTPAKPVSRLLFSLSRTKVPCELSSLVIHANQGYSDAFIRLTWPFYLNMSQPNEEN